MKTIKNLRYPFKANETVSYETAFRAMEEFLIKFHIRGGGVEDSLFLLLNFISKDPASDAPSDPAQWKDWLDAIQMASSDDNGVSKELH